MYQYKYHDNIYHFEESSEAYISPYTLFLLESYPLNLKTASTVCDYGSGTGILGIVATSSAPSKVTFIEKNPNSLQLTRQNCQSNHIPNLTNLEFLPTSDICFDSYDCIICNPASLPNCVNVNSFCDGGILGLDMIIEVCNYSKTHLSSKGNLYMIITQILPTSLIEKRLVQLNMKYEIVSRSQIPFRTHYSGIKEWVDSLRDYYSEMTYLSHGGQLYETIQLWKISLGDGMHEKH